MDLGRRGLPVGVISVSKQLAGLSVATIYVDTAARRLTFVGAHISSYPIAVGKPSTPTPRGRWHIRYKEMYPAWDVLGTRWMGLDNPAGSYGIHGTNAPWSIGRAVSNGCIRMYNHDIEDIYDLCPIGTPVLIDQWSETFPPPTSAGFGPSVRRSLRRGDRGNDVAALQRRLAELGYYRGSIDGMFGPQTQRAVCAFQSSHGIPPDGVAGPETLSRLGL